MLDSVKRPSQLGTALRAEEKSIRTASHLSVLIDLTSAFSLDVVLEHGMGKSSTPFFHKTTLSRLLSIENSPIWNVCEDCGWGSKRILHEIKTFSDVNNETFRDVELSFIDGEEQERMRVLQSSIDSHVRFIIEHDVESLTKIEHLNRIKLLKSAGYLLFQSVSENPETLLAFRDHNDSIKFFLTKRREYTTL